ETGISNDNEVEILKGLEQGDTVVVSAQFLIDSESSLQASYRRMTSVEH
ncbi:MAG: efflux transporter periplasmic adaptor subunit, partial [Gammaproteobacteria bacterium]